MTDARILIELTDDPIDLESLTGLIADPDVGAHGWFIGVTRRTTGDRLTEQLSYESHRAMARRELESIGKRAQQKFDLTHLVLVHRLGEVGIGQASIVVGCSSGHRSAVFAALPWIMDAVKQDVPIWKQETFADGTTEWVHPNP